MSRWSTKPAEHKADRLRNNQRRHRQRVKDHISDLESRLKETQLQLGQALDRVAELTQELDQVRAQTEGSACRPCREPLGSVPVENESISGDGSIRHSWFQKISESGEDLYDHCSIVKRTALVAHEPSASPQTNDTNPMSPVPKSTPVPSAAPDNSSGRETVVANSQAQPDDYGEDEYCALPPPAPGKSTTRCRDAYIIIAQQNYKALDSYVIRQWLEPGFYGAPCDGDGCRVDTELLFALLDFISSD